VNHVAEVNANYKKFWRDLKSGRFISMVQESAKGESIKNPADVFNVMKPLFAQQPDVEVVYCIFMDAQNKILSIEKMFSGTLTCSTIYPREIVKHMIRANSSALVMVHNHPSGNSNPSDADIQVTRKVFIAMAGIDALLHDHIIIGDHPFSLSDNGHISTFKSEYTRLIHG
jgi:DNA repair protein RadC